MKISDIEKQLQVMKEELGDVEVFSKHNGFGGYSINKIRELSSDELYGDMCEESSKNS